MGLPLSIRFYINLHKILSIISNVFTIMFMVENYVLHIQFGDENRTNCSFVSLANIFQILTIPYSTFVPGICVTFVTTSLGKTHIKKGVFFGRTTKGVGRDNPPDH